MKNGTQSALRTRAAAFQLQIAPVRQQGLLQLLPQAFPGDIPQQRGISGQAFQQRFRRLQVQLRLKAGGPQDAQAVVLQHLIGIGGDGVQNALPEMGKTAGGVDHVAQPLREHLPVQGVDAEIPAQGVHGDVRGEAHLIRLMAAAVAVLPEGGVLGHMPRTVRVGQVQFDGAEMSGPQMGPYLRALAHRQHGFGPGRAAHVHVADRQTHQGIAHRAAHDVQGGISPLKHRGGAMDPCRFAQHFFSLKARNSLISPRTTFSALRQ